jgi:hypothetical protein
LHIAKPYLFYTIIQARLVEWEGSVHDGGVLSAQWVGQDLVPEATKWVNEYIKDMRKITD